ncbi:alkaline phosphatase [Catenovulum sp. 2E275]|uniref:alkaline phosphatase n=1 Tax=Catenovulum sp. 2E275 TaxID=2980497 RepID=UPI0021D0E266|nr:alkaline phosphatase [Catenovulum sp. 2E275]MCU4674917.1 alkaline phosphatase [Catenovulum sp. 2E275]
MSLLTPAKACISGIFLLTVSSFAFADTAPKNIIYMIGDGMGVNYLSAYRYFKMQTPNQTVKNTEFDKIWRGTAMTYPADNTFVTDSAAAATALATTHKSYNGAISVDHEHQSLYTLMEAAKSADKKTGLVVTSEVTHATPASFYAHQKYRKEYPQIADQIVDNQINNKPVMDLLLGGGQEDLIRDDRNIVTELNQLGYQGITEFKQLDKLTQLPAVGVFYKRGFPSAIDSTQTRLAEMTSKALDLLSSNNNKGFVLLIEGSQIDWCGHANDVACAMAEMTDFENALKVVLNFIKNNPDTLVVVTADHETGGMSLGADGQYQWLPDVIAKVHSSSIEIAKTIAASQADHSSISASWLKHIEFDLTNAEIAQLQQIKHNKELTQAELITQLTTQIKVIINQRSFTGWTSSGHTGLDVPVLAHGVQAELFNGFQNNTDIAERLHKLIKP